mmetsp:Transcript_16520/g.47655  ORF Transcript_16520/g.47655 Transcript_16520/m.47655 type:complete len:445 (+) Transcript_16520:2058-3392(+)
MLRQARKDAGAHERALRVLGRRHACLPAPDPGQGARARPLLLVRDADALPRHRDLRLDRAVDRPPPPPPPAPPAAAHTRAADGVHCARHPAARRRRPLRLRPHLLPRSLRRRDARPQLLRGPGPGERERGPGGCWLRAFPSEPDRGRVAGWLGRLHLRLLRPQGVQRPHVVVCARRPPLHRLLHRAGRALLPLHLAEQGAPGAVAEAVRRRRRGPGEPRVGAPVQAHVPHPRAEGPALAVGGRALQERRPVGSRAARDEPVRKVPRRSAAGRGAGLAGAAGAAGGQRGERGQRRRRRGRAAGVHLDRQPDRRGECVSGAFEARHARSPGPAHDLRVRADRAERGGAAHLGHAAQLTAPPRRTDAHVPAAPHAPPPRLVPEGHDEPRRRRLFAPERGARAARRALPARRKGLPAALGQLRPPRLRLRAGRLAGAHLTLRAAQDPR